MHWYITLMYKIHTLIYHLVRCPCVRDFWFWRAKNQHECRHIEWKTPLGHCPWIFRASHTIIGRVHTRFWHDVDSARLFHYQHCLACQSLLRWQCLRSSDNVNDGKKHEYDSLSTHFAVISGVSSGAPDWKIEVTWGLIMAAQWHFNNRSSCSSW